MTFDRKTFLSDPTLLAALGAHVRSRVPASDAEDVVQSILADALAAESAPEEADALKRWVFGVARHKIADFHRRTKRAPRPDDAVDDRAAPSSGREGAKDLLQWAEGELPPGSDAKRTFEWMLREGEGEKLESIAEAEKVPAPRVRKRVSRMREHFRARWAAYVAALAAAGIAVIVAFYIFRKKPEPEARIIPEKTEKTPLDLAKEERGRALDACDRAEWEACVAGLDRAAQTDPAGDRDERVVRARDAARRALTPAPLPSPSVTPIPSPMPTPTPTAPPRPTATATSVTPAVPMHSSGSGSL